MDGHYLTSCKETLVEASVNYDAINLRGNYGAHTLRKTFGYIQRTVHGVGFEVLAKRFNHANPRITIRSLNITDAEVNGILLHEI